MRRKRNDAFYDVVIISDAEAQEAVSTAEQFLRLVEADIKKRISCPSLMSPACTFGKMEIELVGPPGLEPGTKAL